MAGTAVFQSGTIATPGPGIVVATDPIGGTQWQQVKLDVGPAGTSIPLSYGGTGMPLGTLPGTVSALGTFQPLPGSVHLASGTVSVLGTVQTAGTSQIIGTVQAVGTLPIGTIAGTVSVGTVAGTVQVLGSVQTVGTSQALGTVQLVGAVPVGTIAGTVSIGTVAGTVQTLGTTQPLAGSVHLATNLAGGTVVSVGSAAHGATADTRPHLIGAFGSSGTQVAVADGQATRLWADLNGRLQVRGTIDSFSVAVPVGTIAGTVSIGTVAGTVQALGTTQPLAGSVHLASRLPGTVDIGTIAGTVSVLGTIQPLAGSVHLASNLAGGTVVAVGSALHGATADTRPVLHGAFGSSGTQTAVADGQAVRLWADLNGRLQIRGTIDQMPSITVSQGTIPGGTVATQPITTGAGTYVAARLTDGANYYTVTGGAVNVADQAAFTAGVSAGAPIMGISTVTAIGQGSIGLLAMGSDRVQLVRPYGGTLDGGTQSIVGTVQIRGTIDSMPAISIGTISGGTIQAFGTTQVLGSVQTVGTVSVGTIAGVVQVGTIAGTVGVLGSVQTVGTGQVLGTVQVIEVEGTSQVQGFIGAGTLAAGNPLIIGAVGSSGTLAAVGDGSTRYLWSDVSGRLQVRGTIDSFSVAVPVGTVAGTVSIGTIAGLVQVGTIAGTVSIGTIAGTVAVGTIASANIAGGTIVAVGSALHGAAADTRPVLIAAFGSSGTQAAVGNGQATRLAADLNGRLNVFIGTISGAAGTLGVGTVQQIVGTVPVGTIAGTVSIGTVAGTISVGTIAGTVSIGTVAGTVQVRPAGVAGESFIGTIFAGAAFSTVAILANPASGTFVRLFDVIVSGSAAGTARLEFGSAAGTLISTIFSGDNGGLSFQSSRGIRSPGTAKGVYMSASAGTWGVMINYTLEN